MNFKAVLALPKTAPSAQTYKSITFIPIVWSTLYVYLCLHWQNLDVEQRFMYQYQPSKLHWPGCPNKYGSKSSCTDQSEHHLVVVCNNGTVEIADNYISSHTHTAQTHTAHWPCQHCTALWPNAGHILNPSKRLHAVSDSKKRSYKKH